MKLLRSNLLKFLLLSFIGVAVISSCDKVFEKDYSKEPDKTQELWGGVSKTKTVALGDTLTFVDGSLGVKNRTWTFPNGDPEVSSDPEVRVVFNEQGREMRVENPTLEIEYFDGSKETKTFDIEVYPVLIAKYVQTADRIKVGETVSFTNQSIGLDFESENGNKFLWEFEGAENAQIYTTNIENPTVTFTDNKLARVTLTIERGIDGAVAFVFKDSLQVGPPELLLNGDFEKNWDPETNIVKGWQTWGSNNTAWDDKYKVEEGGANGTAYTSTFDYNGTLSNMQILCRDFDDYRVDLENGRDYILSMYVKAEKPFGLSLSLFRVDNHIMDAEWFVAKAPVVASFGAQAYEDFGANDGSISTLPVALTTKWQLVSIRISIPDDGVPRNNAYPEIFISDGVETINSKIYIDEISLKVVEPGFGEPLEVVK
jgi:hypothetical protein